MSQGVGEREGERRELKRGGQREMERERRRKKDFVSSATSYVL